MADKSSVIVRKSTLDDLDDLEELMKNLTEMFHQQFFKDQWRMDMKYKYEVGGIFVAEDTIENKICGMILVEVGRDLRSGRMVGKVLNFVVDPTFRGKGIGSKLLEQALDYSARKKAVSVKINARRELSSTVELFKKFGFEEVYMVMEREL